MKTLMLIGTALTLVSTPVLAAEVCTITVINGRVSVGCSNINNGQPAVSPESVTTALKSKIDAGFELAGQTADIGGPQNSQLAVVYTLIKR